MDGMMKPHFLIERSGVFCFWHEDLKSFGIEIKIRQQSKEI